MSTKIMHMLNQQGVCLKAHILFIGRVSFFSYTTLKWTAYLSQQIASGKLYIL